MRKSSTFRPLILDSLEDRVVLSQVKPSAAVSHHAALTPQQVTTSKVAGAYGTFVQSFTQDVNSDLYMPSATGSGASTAIFSENLGVALTDLAKSVRKTLGNVSPRSPLSIQVRQAILGSDVNSLKSQLSGMTTTTVQGGYSISGFESAAVQEIRQNYQRVDKLIVTSMSSPSTTTTTSQTSTGSTSHGGASTY